MRFGGWGVAVGAAVLAGAVGCSPGNGQSGAGTGTATANTTGSGITAATLKAALLTSVNGVGAAGPAKSGMYPAVAKAVQGTSATASTQATPKACGGSATALFNPSLFAREPAVGVTFRVDTNEVSEALVASSATSAATALSGHIPAGCAHFSAQVGGKTASYTLKEQAVTGVGTAAKALDVQTVGNSANNQWFLVYRGTGFVGTVSVAGPNASEKAVQELGQQAYAFAAKMLK